MAHAHKHTVSTQPLPATPSTENTENMDQFFVTWHLRRIAFGPVYFVTRHTHTQHGTNPKRIETSFNGALCVIMTNSICILVNDMVSFLFNCISNLVFGNIFARRCHRHCHCHRNRKLGKPKRAACVRRTHTHSVPDNRWHGCKLARDCSHTPDATLKYKNLVFYTKYDHLNRRRPKCNTNPSPPTHTHTSARTPHTHTHDLKKSNLIFVFCSARVFLPVIYWLECRLCSVHAIRILCPHPTRRSSPSYTLFKRKFFRFFSF